MIRRTKGYRDAKRRCEEDDKKNPKCPPQEDGEDKIKYETMVDVVYVFDLVMGNQPKSSGFQQIIKEKASRP